MKIHLNVIKYAYRLYLVVFKQKIDMRLTHTIIFSSFLCAVMLFGAFPARAGSDLQLEVVTIQGNRELPKVLYIVPWKRLKSDRKAQKLVLHSLFEDAFDPMDPDVFKKHVDAFQRQNH